MSKTKNLQELFAAMSEFCATISKNSLTDGDIIHITDCLEALSENPKALKIDRTRLNLVWKRSHEFIKIYKNGYLLIVINKSFLRHKAAISNAVKGAGVAAGDFKIVEYTTLDAVSKMVRSDDCRAVLYVDGLPKEFLEELSPTTSQKMDSYGEGSVRRAIVLLSDKLGYH